MNAPVLPKRRKPPLAETPISALEGDEAVVTFDRAIEAAFERTVSRGCKQQVRGTRFLDGSFGGFWVVQDVR